MALENMNGKKITIIAQNITNKCKYKTCTYWHINSYTQLVLKWCLVTSEEHDMSTVGTHVASGKVQLELM